MKSDVMPSIIQIREEDLQKLCAEVKETIATGIMLSKKKSASFGAADLWSARRKMRTAGKLWSNKTMIHPLV